MKRIITILTAALALTTGCAEESSDRENSEFEAVFENLDGPSDLAAPVETEEVELEEGEEDYEVFEAFVRDCNICVRTANGAVCTLQACDEIDDRAAGSCADDSKKLGDVWADDCNMCTCTAAGTVCTIEACDESFHPDLDLTNPPNEEECGAQDCNDNH